MSQKDMRTVFVFFGWPQMFDFTTTEAAQQCKDR
jgi:hypothetical protein